MSWKAGVFAATALVLAVSGCGANTTGNTSSQNTGSQQTTGSTTNAATANTSNSTQASTVPVGNFSPLVGKAAPGFTLKTLNGKSSVGLKDLLHKGKPILVNAFASWCPPCNLEAPDLEKLSQQYKGKVNVIGVDMTTNDTAGGAQKFVKKHSITYPVLLDTTGNFEKKYGVTAFPSTFAISPSGKVILFHLGYMTKQDMTTIIKKLEHSS